MALDPNSHIQEVKALTVDIRPGRRPRGPARDAARAASTVRARRASPSETGIDGSERHCAAPQASTVSTAAAGAADPAGDAGYEEHPPRMGFFTDTSVCIGCKACEVACKEWNQVPEDGLNCAGHVATTTPASWAPTPGATSRSSSSARRSAASGELPARGRLSLADGLRRVQALHARRLPGRVPDRARSSAPSSAPSSSSRTSATAAATACRPAPTACSTSARTTGASSSARSATTGSGSARSRPAPRPARPTRSSSASWTSCASAPGAVEQLRRRRHAGAPLRPTPMTASAATEIDI